MLVCDMCLDEVAFHITENQVQIGKGLFSDEYIICNRCKKKLEKYIRFEQARAKKRTD